MLTGGRFLALLAGANRDSDLIQGLYDVSEFWVEPFFNLFGLSDKAVQNTGGVFEPASLIAFMVYLMIGVFYLRHHKGRSVREDASCVDAGSFRLGIDDGVHYIRAHGGRDRAWCWRLRTNTAIDKEEQNG